MPVRRILEERRENAAMLAFTLILVAALLGGFVYGYVNAEYPKEFLSRIFCALGIVSLMNQIAKRNDLTTQD